MKTINALVPVYGSNRMGAAKVGELLAGCKWVGIAFAGGLSEVPQIKALTVVCNDAHRQIINLARAVADPVLKAAMVARLDDTPFHPDALAESQRFCMAADVPIPPALPDPEAAYHYFVCSWMARNGTAATAGEFKAGLSMRWDANGGDSVVRFRNAATGLTAWSTTMRRCTFSVQDWREFLKCCKDEAGHAVYCDSPWPDDGAKYRYPFTERDQIELADRLLDFRRAKVVVRFGDHPLIRRLYSEENWEWLDVTGRTATNRVKSEVLLLRRQRKPLTAAANGAASQSPAADSVPDDKPAVGAVVRGGMRTVESGRNIAAGSLFTTEIDGEG